MKRPHQNATKSYQQFPALTVADIDRRWKFPRLKRVKKKALKS